MTTESEPGESLEAGMIFDGMVRHLTVIACWTWGARGFHWQPRWVNGQEIADWEQGVALNAFTTQRRAEGWSLKQTYQGHDAAGTATLKLYFISPKD